MTEELSPLGRSCITLCQLIEAVKDLFPLLDGNALVGFEDGGDIAGLIDDDITRDRALADTLFSVLSGLWFQPDELAVTVENLLTALDAING